MGNKFFYRFIADLFFGWVTPKVLGQRAQDIRSEVLFFALAAPSEVILLNHPPNGLLD